MNNESPWVFFDLMVLIACGKKDKVVSKAAENPIKEVKVITNF
jgi:hypothetical protein